MTWFTNAFSVISKGASAGLQFASTYVKPVLGAIISVAPSIASAARSLAVIPIIGQAALAVSQAAVLAETVARVGKDIIRVAEDFDARMRPAHAPAQVPIFAKTEPVQEAPIAVSVVPQPKPATQISPAPIQGGIINYRVILPMPVRHGGVMIDRQYERNLKEMLDELDISDNGVEELLKSFQT